MLLFAGAKRVAGRRALLITLLLVAVVWQLPARAGAQALLDFPQARLEHERTIESASHRVMLSGIQEVGNELRAERSARLAVEGHGRLYELESGATRQDARRWYLEQLQTRNATILFRCSGRECGRSNVWANQVFNEATLYGRDARQDYLVAGLEDNDGQRWLITLYTVTRGNQREYLWLEQLALADDAEVPGLEGRTSRLAGPVIVPWSGDISVSFQWNSDDRRVLKEMASAPDARIVIAGFSELGPGETLEDSLERAERAAETMSDLLDRSGLSRSRHVVRSVGPLVRFSAPERPENRVEILVVSPPEEGSNE
ncbi:MAG: DUF4892 domain-containing protein [Marinobacter sp.]